MTIVDHPSAVVVLESVDSTQDAARRLLVEGRDDVIGVRADFQSAGRGRTGHVWVAPPGTCLLITYIVRGTSVRPGRVARLAFAAGLAVAESVEALTGLSPGLKWPNDVVLGGRKVAGMLVETACDPQGSMAALVGIGLNVNVETLPPEIAESASSLRIKAGRTYEIDTVEAVVRERLMVEIGALTESGFPDLLERWRRRDVTSGTRFRADLGGRRLEGRAAGVSDTGGLMLLLDSGEYVEIASATSIVGQVA